MLVNELLDFPQILDRQELGGAAESREPPAEAVHAAPRRFNANVPLPSGCSANSVRGRR